MEEQQVSLKYTHTHIDLKRCTLLRKSYFLLDPPLIKILLRLQVRGIKITLHGKELGVPEMAGPMSAAVIKGALNLLLAQEVRRAQEMWSRFPLGCLVFAAAVAKKKKKSVSVRMVRLPESMAVVLLEMALTRSDVYPATMTHSFDVSRYKTKNIYLVQLATSRISKLARPG